MRGAADLLVVGRVATLAGPAGFGWVEALAIAGGRVVAAGSRDEVEALAGPATRRILVGPELVVVPGIIDAHLHLGDAALAAQRVDLEGASSIEAGLARVEQAVAHALDPEAWIEGGGWDPAAWGRWPAATDLVAVAGDRRVALWSHDHHALWVSPRVLVELGLDAATPDPPGGTFRRAADGSPDGVLQETAAQAVVARLPSPSHAALETAIASYARSLLALGVVGIHDPGDLLADATLEGGFGVAVSLAERRELPIRVHCSIRAPALGTAVERGLRTGAPLGGDGSDRVTMGWLKLFADGALGSRTALLLAPYEGTPDHGVAVTPADELAALALRAAAAGIVPQIHAIGDAALQAAIAALAPVAPSVGPMARVEHVQFADPADLLAMARARIAASIQPIHLRSDVAKARRAWGPRTEQRGFLLRSLLAAGVPTAFGTDAPVEPADPWPGISIAVTRAAPTWPAGDVFAPTEALALSDALRAATRGPATLADQPDRGHLGVGAHADFLAIPAASLAEPVERDGALWHTHPAFTAVAGKVVFEA